VTTELATIEATELAERNEPRGALADLRANALSVPVQVMQAALGEYADRRKAFRDWLKAQLVPGTHYGFPPGCEPKPDPERPGNYMIYMKGGYKSYPKAQWEPKPSLYQAGADFIVDLMGARPEFAADIDGWRQLGEPKDTFIYACRLYSRATGELLGEGRGVRAVGQKGGDANNAIKMAQKSAKVAAVLNTWGLADLWTQDLEDMTPPPHNNPPSDPEAPPPPAPRGKRDSKAHPLAAAVKYVGDNWKSRNLDPDGNAEAMREHFREWVAKTTNRFFDPFIASKWTADDVTTCCRALNIEVPPEVANA
jgi:hypothetical protein